MGTQKHTPVLLPEVLSALNIERGKKYIDATAGEGGHSLAIADAGGTVLAIDKDPAQIEALTTKHYEKDIVFVCASYADIADVARRHDFIPADGILFDLGLSMHQLTDGKRGFSFKNLDEPLDMRLNPSEQIESAADIISQSNEEELYSVIAMYSEEYHARAIAHILAGYKKKKYLLVKDVLRAIDTALEHCTQTHEHKKELIYTRVFQAIRVWTNDEYHAIEEGITQAVQCLTSGGVLCVITFHSGEDRIVKQLSRKLGLRFTVEKAQRPRSFERSAVLRILTK